MILASSCSQEEIVQQQTVSLSDCKFVASFEQNESRTYLEDGKYLRWTANDELSIFMGKTLNRQFRFTGETGDNSGGFEEASSPGFVTGNDLDNPCHYAIYPYAKATKITETGVITVNLPSEQTYAENSFGCGANTMVAVTSSLSDMELSFKNACGYLRFKLYGDDVTIKSVTLQSNGEEKLSGSATLTAANDKNPSTTMSSTASDMITLDCGTGVKIGSTSETATEFWFVVPPTTFKSGFTVTIKDVNDNEFTKSTSKKISIERNIIKPISAFEVEIETIPNNQIWYTSSDGNIITNYNTSAFGINIKSNVYENGKGIITFDNDLTTIGTDAFYSCSSLINITIPNSVDSIGPGAFAGCSKLKEFKGRYASDDGSCLVVDGVLAAYAEASGTEYHIPDNVIEIGSHVFSGFGNLKQIDIPYGVKTIGSGAFQSCQSLTSITIPNSVTEIKPQAFLWCYNLTNAIIGDNVTSIGESAFSSCKIASLTIPDNVETIGRGAFQYCGNLTDVTIGHSVSEIRYEAFNGCYNLTNVTIPSSVKKIGNNAFAGCSNLINVYCKPETPPAAICWYGENNWGAFDSNASGRKIYVPRGYGNIYKAADGWIDYEADIIEYDF